MKIESTKVSGDDAAVTAVIERPGPAGSSRCYRLKKEDGDWKLAGAGVDADGRRQARVEHRRGRRRASSRIDVLAQLCDEVAARHSGRRPRRDRHLGRDRVRDAPDGAADAPERDGGAAGGVRGGAGEALPHLRRAAPGARRAVRAGAAHVLRHVGAHALPERAPHAADAAPLARGAGDQRERHDDDRRDLVRRQRLPRRAGGDPARRRPARAAHRHRTGSTAPTRGTTPTRGWSSEVAGVEELEGYEIGVSRSPLGSGGMRSKVVAAEMATAAGIPVTIASGVEREVVARRSRASPAARASSRRRAACRASSCG